MTNKKDDTACWSVEVLAFHGDYASPEILQRDMGNPEWVDKYIDWTDMGKSIFDYFDEKIRNGTKFILAGYSSGGSMCLDLSKYFYSHILGIIDYEGPNFTRDYIPGNFPVYLVWNTLSRPFRNRLRQWTRDSLTMSKHRHPIIDREGKGFHIRYLPPPQQQGLSPFGHNWDQDLNQEIGKYIATWKYKFYFNICGLQSSWPLGSCTVSNPFNYYMEKMVKEEIANLETENSNLVTENNKKEEFSEPEEISTRLIPIKFFYDRTDGALYVDQNIQMGVQKRFSENNKGFLYFFGETLSLNTVRNLIDWISKIEKRWVILEYTHQTGHEHKEQFGLQFKE